MSRASNENPGIPRIPEPGEEGYDDLAGWILYLHQLRRPVARLSDDGRDWVFLGERLPYATAAKLTERVGLDPACSDRRWVAIVAGQVLGTLRGYAWRRTPGVSDSQAPVGRDCTVIMVDDEARKRAAPKLVDHRRRTYEDLSLLVSWTAEEKAAIEAVLKAAGELERAIADLAKPDLGKVASWFEWTSGLPRITAAPLMVAQGLASRPCKHPAGRIDDDGTWILDGQGYRDNEAHDAQVNGRIRAFWDGGTRARLDALPLVWGVVSDLHLQARSFCAADPRAKTGPRRVMEARARFADEVAGVFDRLAQVSLVVHPREIREWKQHVMANRRPFVAKVMGLLGLADHRVTLDGNGDAPNNDWFRRVNKGQNLQPLNPQQAYYVSHMMQLMADEEAAQVWDTRCITFVDRWIRCERPALPRP